MTTNVVHGLRVKRLRSLSDITSASGDVIAVMLLTGIRLDGFEMLSCSTKMLYAITRTWIIKVARTWRVLTARHLVGRDEQCLSKTSRPVATAIFFARSTCCSRNCIDVALTMQAPVATTCNWQIYAYGLRGSLCHILSHPCPIHDNPTSYNIHQGPR